MKNIKTIFAVMSVFLICGAVFAAPVMASDQKWVSSLHMGTSCKDYCGPVRYFPENSIRISMALGCNGTAGSSYLSVNLIRHRGTATDTWVGAFNQYYNTNIGHTWVDCGGGDYYFHFIKEGNTGLDVYANEVDIYSLNL